ncbi:MAG: sigma-70 family RNA polymerase sigma factor [Chloroflexi bacterium]|nr:sigma-70 family RNA polymerase sigma factor [Chloroflexota bacterium]
MTLGAPVGDLFSAEVEPHIHFLFRIALRLTHDVSSAEDLLQDTLERALRNFERYEPGTNVRAWLLRIMHNLRINYHRARACRPRAVSLEQIEAPSAHQGRGQRGGDAQGVESVILSQLGEEEIFRAIDDLPDRFREVISLADVEELDYKDIAARLRIPVGTVASRVYRGRRQLRQMLPEQAGDHPFLSATG